MKKQRSAQVRLSVKAQMTVLQDVYQRHRIEACGVLLGDIDEQGNWLIEDAYPLRNSAESPVYFEFSPEELFAAELRFPDQIVGVYHSHPTGLARASGTDRENMQRVNQEQQIPWVWLIVSGPFDPAKLPALSLAHLSKHALRAYYHDAQEGLQEIALRLTDATFSPSDPVEEPKTSGRAFQF